MTKITTSGKTGEASDSLIAGQASMMRKPQRVVSEATLILPSTMKSPPTLSTMLNLPACLRKRVKPATAEVQKFSEVRAIWMYAFRLMNLKHLSMQETQHYKQHRKHLTTTLAPTPDLLDAFSMTLSMILTDQISASMNDPKASEPQWYLNSHAKPVLIFAFPFVSELWLKYQVQQATMTTNWEQAMMKETSQRIPKLMKQTM